MELCQIGESIPDVLGLGQNAAMNLGRSKGPLDTRTAPTRAALRGEERLARVVSEYSLLSDPNHRAASI